MTLKPFPTQLFINNTFVNSTKGTTFDTINPSTEQLVAKVQQAGKEDIDLAVSAAKNAFEKGAWAEM